MTMTKKPIVSIVCHGALANITLDFRSKDDVDLAMVPKLIEEYEHPINSVPPPPNKFKN